MKKIFAFLLAFSLLCFPLTVGGAGETAISLSDAAGCAGDTVTLALMFKDAGKLSAVSVDVEFDPTALTYAGFSAGEGLTADHFSTTLVGSGVLRLTFTDSKTDYTALGPVGYIKFKIASSASGTLSVDIVQKSGTLFDSGYAELDYRALSGTVTVTKRFPSVGLQTASCFVYLESPVSAKALAAMMPSSVTLDSSVGVIGTGHALGYGGNVFYTVLRGDLNCDGQISTADYVYMKAFFAGKLLPDSPSLAATDTDGNGEYNLTDALFLKKALIKG